MQLLKYKFDVEQYQQMGKAGIFHPENRVELIEGEIIVMPPNGLSILPPSIDSTISCITLSKKKELLVSITQFVCQIILNRNLIL